MYIGKKLYSPNGRELASAEELKKYMTIKINILREMRKSSYFAMQFEKGDLTQYNKIAENLKVKDENGNIVEDEEIYLLLVSEGRMKKISEKYLPIGTVVMLKGGTKRVMISGFCAFEDVENKEGERKIWDYSGCLYPEGFLKSNQTCLFDHEQIVEIYHLGLSADEDNEEKEFKENLNKIVEEAKSNNTVNNKKNDNTNSSKNE